ncbi:hypothetical protein D3C84_677100 [compost metagenome]
MELQEEALQRPGAGPLGQAVGAEAGEAAFGLFRIQAGGPAVQLLQAAFDGLGVPMGGGWGAHVVLHGESWGKPSSFR